MNRHRFDNLERTGKEKIEGEIDKVVDNEPVKGKQHRSCLKTKCHGANKKIKTLSRLWKKYWDKWVSFQEHGSRKSKPEPNCSHSPPGVSGYEEISCIEVEIPDLMLGDVDRVRTTCKECANDPPKFPTKEEIKSKLISADKYYGIVEQSKRKSKLGKTSGDIKEEGTLEADCYRDEGNLIRPNWRHILDRPLVEQYVLMTNYIRKISVLSELNWEPPKVKIDDEYREKNEEVDDEFKKFADKYKRETRQLITSLKKPVKKEREVQTAIQLIDATSDISCFPDSSSLYKERSTVTIVTSRDFSATDWDSVTNPSDTNVTEKKKIVSLNSNQKPSLSQSSDKKTSSGSASDGTAIPIHSTEGSISLKGTLDQNRRKVTFSPMVQYYQAPVISRGLYVLPLVEESTTTSIGRFIESNQEPMKSPPNVQPEMIDAAEEPPSDPKVIQGEAVNLPTVTSQLRENLNGKDRPVIVFQQAVDTASTQNRKIIGDEGKLKKLPGISLLNEELVEITRYDTDTFYPKMPDEEEPHSTLLQTNINELGVQKMETAVTSKNTGKITLTQNETLCFGGKVRSTPINSQQVRITNEKREPKVDHNVYQKTSNPKMNNSQHRRFTTNDRSFVLLNSGKKITIAQQRKMRKPNGDKMIHSNTHTAVMSIDKEQNIENEKVKTQRNKRLSAILSNVENNSTVHRPSRENPNTAELILETKETAEPAPLNGTSLQQATLKYHALNEVQNCINSPLNTPEIRRKLMIDTGKSMSVEELKNIFERKLLDESPNTNKIDTCGKYLNSCKTADTEDNNQNGRHLNQRNLPAISKDVSKTIDDQTMKNNSEGENNVCLIPHDSADGLNIQTEYDLEENFQINECTFTPDTVTSPILDYGISDPNDEHNQNEISQIEQEHDFVHATIGPSLNETIKSNRTVGDNTGRPSKELELYEDNPCDEVEIGDVTDRGVQDCMDRSNMHDVETDSDSLVYCQKSSTGTKNVSNSNSQNKNHLMERAKTEGWQKVEGSNEKKLLNFETAGSFHDETSDRILPMEHDKPKIIHSTKNAELLSQGLCVSFKTEVEVSNNRVGSNSGIGFNADDETWHDVTDVLKDQNITNEDGNMIKQTLSEIANIAMLEVIYSSELTPKTPESDEGKAEVIVESRTYSFNSIYTASEDQFEHIEYTRGQNGINPIDFSISQERIEFLEQTVQKDQPKRALKLECHREMPLSIFNSCSNIEAQDGFPPPLFITNKPKQWLRDVVPVVPTKKVQTKVFQCLPRKTNSPKITGVTETHQFAMPPARTVFRLVKNS